MQLIQVVAAVLKDGQGRVLVNQRPAGKPWAGYWEFPGGKIEAGETPRTALERELQEELGVKVREARPWLQLSHDYPERRVELDVWRVHGFSGTPHAREGQALARVQPEELDGWRLLPADAPIVTALRLPPQMLVTPSPDTERSRFFDALDKALQRGAEFVQLRAPEIAPPGYAQLAREVIALCRARGVRAVLNAAPELARELAADGVHLSSARLAGISQRPLPKDFLTGASCHDEAEIRRAQALGLDYLVLGPVLRTPSHPQAKVLGWEGFARLAALSPLPVYAIGGMRPEHQKKARALGGHGIAAIRSLWSAG
ncbi:MAG TPA: Nudix family hydrolase [Gammaproteobacteria bacterium]|nr:Nudix family hydrolase [Gammaproteobacteria bacterium]